MSDERVLKALYPLGCIAVDIDGKEFVICTCGEPIDRLEDELCWKCQQEQQEKKEQEQDENEA